MGLLDKVETKVRNIEEAISRLLFTKSFYATVVAGITRQEVPKEVCDTMAVCCDPNTYLGIKLIYCKEFIEKISEDTKFFEFIVEHEMVHLLLEHIQRYWDNKLLKNIPHKVANIAADLANNSAIVKHYPDRVKERVAKEAWLPGPESSSEIARKYKPDRSMEVYALALGNEIEEDFEERAVTQHLWGQMLVDGNLVKANPKDLSKCTAKQEMNLPDYVQECVQQHERRQGSIPGYVKELIKGYLDVEGQVSWAEILYATIKSGMPCFRKRSIMRPNRRRWGMPDIVPKFPGKITERAYNVAFLIDTSGSISNTDLKAAAGVLCSLMDHYRNVAIWVVEADTQVHRNYRLKTIDEFRYDIHGRGGTDFVEPLKWAEDNISPDIALYFTDGYGRAPDIEPEYTLVWVTPKGYRAPAKYGTHIEITYEGIY
jgi:predicted metal-dependent peptidase